MANKICPVCSADVEFLERFPDQVCERCRSRTADAYGRRLKFSRGAAGGLQAFYLDNGAEYHRQICYIDGRKCFVSEHRFGGIVVEIVKDQL